MPGSPASSLVGGWGCRPPKGVRRIIGIRDRAVILLGYGSAMRPGEISALNLADIVPKPTGVLINVRRSKTDQDGQGELIGVARGQHRETDPIRAPRRLARHVPKAPARC
jgi:integrase